jgi:hypothetical protein
MYINTTAAFECRCSIEMREQRALVKSDEKERLSPPAAQEDLGGETAPFSVLIIVRTEHRAKLA